MRHPTCPLCQNNGIKGFDGSINSFSAVRIAEFCNWFNNFGTNSNVMTSLVVSFWNSTAETEGNNGFAFL